MVNATLILLLVFVVAIWLFIEFKRFRHKIVAVFLILLIVFTYFSFVSVVKGKDLDLMSIDGAKEAGRLYLVWIGHAFKNVKVVTSNVISMDWRGNETLYEIPEENNSVQE